MKRPKSDQQKLYGFVNQLIGNKSPEEAVAVLKDVLVHAVVNAENDIFVLEELAKTYGVPAPKMEQFLITPKRTAATSEWKAEDITVFESKSDDPEIVKRTANYFREYGKPSKKKKFDNVEMRCAGCNTHFFIKSPVKRGRTQIPHNRACPCCGSTGIMIVT